MSEKLPTPDWAAAKARALKSLETITPNEDAEITAAALADPDAQPLSDNFMAGMRPVSEVAPELIKRARGQRGRQKSPTKEQVTVRLDRDVLDRFRAQGEGWQSRLNGALREWLDSR